METWKEEAVRKNGGIPCRGWIQNLENVDGKIKLYATGDCTIATGRIYVALSANEKMTEELKRKHNIM